MNSHKRAFSLTFYLHLLRMKGSANMRKELYTLRIGLGQRTGTPLWKTLYTYIQLVMPLRKEWKSSPIRVDPQAVIRVEIWRVFKTKLVIILLRAVWIHIVLIWSGFNEIKIIQFLARSSPLHVIAH